jgi:hypothetical protein
VQSCTVILHTHKHTFVLLDGFHMKELLHINLGRGWQIIASFADFYYYFLHFLWTESLNRSFLYMTDGVTESLCISLVS